jgi:alkylhydroperoxidase family enzyme
VTPRILPLPEAEWSATVADLVSQARSSLGAPQHVFTTLAWHPRLLKRWSAFAASLVLGSALGRREGELLVLRTALNCHCDYEWAHHVYVGSEVGLTAAEIRAIRYDDPAHRWSARDRSLLAACDSLHESRSIPEMVWSDLAAELSVEQLIEVPMLVGQYEMLAMTINSIGIAVEGELPALPPELDGLRRAGV